MTDDTRTPDPLREALKPPVTWATIRQDASERGLFSVVDEAMIGRKLTPSRRKLIVGNIVMAVARWRQTFRDCGCWKTADSYALCQWHEAMLQSQVGPLRAALAARPAPDTPTPALDAVAARIEHAEECALSSEQGWTRDPAHCSCGLSAALADIASARPSPDTGLNVERLAEAIFRSGIGYAVIENSPSGAALAGSLAYDVAAEYARLPETFR